MQKADFLRKKKTLFVLFFSKRSAKADPIAITAVLEVAGPKLPVHHFRTFIYELCRTSFLSRPYPVKNICLSLVGWLSWQTLSA